MSVGNELSRSVGEGFDAGHERGNPKQTPRTTAPPQQADVADIKAIEAAPNATSQDGQTTNNSYPQRTSEARPSSSPPPPQSSPRRPLSFAPADPLNPYNWPRGKKLFVTIVGMLMVMNSTIGSSIPAGASDPTAEHFGIENEQLLVLPISVYLIGYIAGPMVFPPLSEAYGRRVIMVSTFVVYTAFTLGCALAPTFSGLIVMRLLVGIGASTPISVIGGIYADIWATPRARGLAITGFMAATTWGPVFGPIISGYVALVSWSWTYWVQLIIAGATWPLLLLLPETYAPVILRGEARRLRRETGDQGVVAPMELEKRDLRNLLVVVLTRPARMFLFEAIVLFSCLYLAFAYGIFYIFFQAFPIIFPDTYNFSSGETGLAFLPIGVGSVFAALLYLTWDGYLTRAKTRPHPRAWTCREEMNRLPLACLGAPLFVLSLFWLGWTARPSIPWIVPVLAALPFGTGFLLIFMSLINYVVDAYEVYAASALGVASASRSIFGVVLPFAARPLYARLGVGWACTLLGGLSLGLSVVPFVFIRYGGRIRAGSKFCQELKGRKEEEMRVEEERERGEGVGEEDEVKV